MMWGFMGVLFDLGVVKACVLAWVGLGPGWEGCFGFEVWTLLWFSGFMKFRTEGRINQRGRWMWRWRRGHRRAPMVVMLAFDLCLPVLE